MIGALCESPSDLRGADRVARRIERRQGAAARHHRPRSDVWRRARSPGRRRRRRACRRIAANAARSTARASRRRIQAARTAAAAARTQAAGRRRRGTRSRRSPGQGRRRTGGSRRFRRRRQSAALGDGSRAEAAGSRNAGQYRRTLQEARPLAGRLGRSGAGRRTNFPPARNAASRSCATRPSIWSRASSSTTTASRRWSIRCTASTAGWSRLEGRLLRLAEAHGVAREDFLKEHFGNELDPNWTRRVGRLSRIGWQDFIAEERDKVHAAARRNPDAGPGDAPVDQRIPPHRADGAEGRARKWRREKGNDRGESAPGDLHRQEIHQPRPAIPRPDPGRQYRADEGGRQIRIPPRLQILDLCDVVDPPGDHAKHRRSGAHHPHSGAHDRDDQQAGAHLAPDAARDRPRADARGTRRTPRHAARKSAQGAQDRQGADSASKRRSATRRIRIWAISSRTRTRSCRSTRRSRPICARPPRACSPR